MISVYKKIKPKNPVFIAAWPGMGHVATYTANYLKNKLKARLFARLTEEAFFNQSEAAVADSLINLPRSPQGKFYYWENPTGENDLIIFISEQQPSAEKTATYTHIILDFIAQFKVKMIFTFAALLATTDYTPAPQVWFTATHKELIADFERDLLRPLTSGHISGLNGLFLAIAKKMKFKGIAVLGEIPFYTTQIDNPYASLSILKIMTKFLNIRLDLTELSLAGKMIEEEVEKLLEPMKNSILPSDSEPTNPITADDIEHIRNTLASHTKMPNSTQRQIEDLFARADKDISCALELKKKLDEWHVYKDYEDRFLGLFRKRDSKDN